jgi:hypothetical protein
MDLSYSPEEQAFEAEVREFLATHLPEDISRRVLARQEITREDMERWHAILNEKGWLAGPWPKEFGGQAWGPGRGAYLRGGMLPRRRAPDRALRDQDAGAGPDEIRLAPSSRRNTCPASSTVVTGGARAIRNRARGRIWPA